MHIGLHLPTSQGLCSAARRGAKLHVDCMQLFSRNPRGWRAGEHSEEEVARFRCLLAEAGIASLALHACYLVNLASPDPSLRQRSERAVADDMVRAARLGATGVAVHPGHHMGVGIETGLRHLAGSLRRVLSASPPSVRLLLENTAGRGSELGGDWQQFSRLLDLLHGDPGLGVCFDTCHAHAAGYRLDSARGVSRALAGVRSAVGMDRVGLLHLNDCLYPAGSRQDRHQHIARGSIGAEGFRRLLRRRDLQHICAVLETPIDRPGDDRRNLRRARELLK
jgi:deoxyribonuclease-4